jgi:hypothetical protein
VVLLVLTRRGSHVSDGWNDGDDGSSGDGSTGERKGRNDSDGGSSDEWLCTFVLVAVSVLPLWCIVLEESSLDCVCSSPACGVVDALGVSNVNGAASSCSTMTPGSRGRGVALIRVLVVTTCSFMGLSG